MTKYQWDAVNINTAIDVCNGTEVTEQIKLQGELQDIEEVCYTLTIQTESLTKGINFVIKTLQPCMLCNLYYGRYS